MNNQSNSSFSSHGSSIHLSLKTVADLDKALKLDDVHWLASTAPSSDFLLPPTFLKYLDRDDDGRLTAEDVREAITWLRSHSSKSQPAEQLDVSDIASDSLTQTWSKILETFNLPADTVIELETIRKCRERYLEEPTKWGSGSLVPDDVEDPQERAILETVQEAVKPEKEAVTEEQFDTFLEEAQLILEWRRASPGDDSWAEEYPIYRKLDEKLAEYFLLADTAEFTGKQPEPRWPEDKPNQQFLEELESLPLAYPLEPQKLDFQSKLNPKYQKQLQDFKRVFLSEGEQILNRETYEELKERFETYADWLDEAPKATHSQWETETLDRWLKDLELQQSLRKKLKEKRESGLVRKDFDDLEKLVLFQSHLLELCQNFVAFPDLYDPKERALFERGTLIMDGREFHLVLPVDDIERHKQAAGRSNMFVLYLEVDGENFAVPVTAGVQGHLAKLKYGILHHVSGKEKVAKVVDLVSNPISFFEALIAPIKKMGTAVKDKIEGLSSEKEKALVDGSLAAPKTVKAESKTSQGSLLAGGGVAVAALGSSFAFVMKTLAGLTPIKILISFLALFLAFLIPAGIVAYLKLRNRDLSAVLEGNAWGINGRMKLTSEQAKQFTRQPRHPGYQAHFTRHLPWIAVVALVLGALYYYRESVSILLGL